MVCNDCFRVFGIDPDYGIRGEDEKEIWVLVGDRETSKLSDVHKAFGYAGNTVLMVILQQ